MSRYRSLPFWALALMPAAAQAYAATPTPQLIDPPDGCTAYYPAGSHARGTTLLMFELVPDGSTKRIWILHSSGDAALDAAAADCVHVQRYRNAASRLWNVQINWDFDGKRGAALASVPHFCALYYPEDEMRRNVEGTTALSFTITPEGAVDDIKVAAGSGDDGLDDAAVACVSHWRYRPSTRDGVPVAALWRTKIAWTIPRK